MEGEKNARLKSFLKKKSEQSLQSVCSPSLSQCRTSWPASSCWEGSRRAPPLSHTFSPALSLGGNRKAADSKIRHFCGSWQGPCSPPPPALEHQVSTSAAVSTRRPGLRLLGATIPPPASGLDQLPGASLSHLDSPSQHGL